MLKRLKTAVIVILMLSIVVTNAPTIHDIYAHPHGMCLLCQSSGGQAYNPCKQFTDGGLYPDGASDWAYDRVMWLIGAAELDMTAAIGMNGLGGDRGEAKEAIDAAENELAAATDDICSDCRLAAFAELNDARSMLYGYSAEVGIDTRGAVIQDCYTALFDLQDTQESMMTRELIPGWVTPNHCGCWWIYEHGEAEVDDFNGGKVTITGAEAIGARIKTERIIIAGIKGDILDLCGEVPGIIEGCEQCLYCGECPCEVCPECGECPENSCNCGGE